MGQYRHGGWFETQMLYISTSMIFRVGSFTELILENKCPIYNLTIPSTLLSKLRVPERIN